MIVCVNMIYTSGENLEEIEMNFDILLNNIQILKASCKEDEELYQQYFSNVNIAARKNLNSTYNICPGVTW